MAVDIGYIIEYDQKNETGLIEGKLTNGLVIRFTLNEVNDLDLFERLQKGTYRGVRVWCSYENGSEPSCATNLWSNLQYLPQIDREKFIKRIEEEWKILKQPKPNLLDGVTKQLGGTELHSQLTATRSGLIEEQQKHETPVDLKQELRTSVGIKNVWKKVNGDLFVYKKENSEKYKTDPLLGQPVMLTTQVIRKSQDLEQQRDTKKRAEKIQDFCRNRGVSTLLHFTRFTHLESILINGLLSQVELARNIANFKPIFNDNQRLDNCRNAICLTISFPNYQMFYKLRTLHENQDVQWVVLALQANILWELDCAFNRTNAANGTMRKIPLNIRMKPETLFEMFADAPTKLRQELSIPNNFTTDPQAEVLVFSPISTKYIQKVILSCPAMAERVTNLNIPNDLHVEFSVDPKMFTYRSDYMHWKKQNGSTDFLNWPDKPPSEENIFVDPNFF